MAKKLLINSFSNVSILVVKYVTVFIMTPIVVRSLGNYDYGIWEIVLSVIGYMGMLRFGLPPAIVRYVAKYKAVDDRENLDRLFSTALIILGAMGAICFMVTSGIALFSPELLMAGGKDTHKYTYFLLIIAVKVQVVFIGLLSRSFHEGFQRYHITNAVVAVNTIVGAFVLYFLLNRGYGLVALAAVNTVGVTLKFLVFYMLLFLPRYGGFRFRIQDIRKATAKSLYGFGFKSFLLGLSGRISNTTAPIIIGSFLSPAIVPFYTIPVGLVRRANTVVESITLGFMPYFSELHAQKASERTKSTYFTASRYITAFVVCSYLGIFFLGLPFIARWMGPSFAENGKIIFYLLAVTFMWPMINPLSGRVLTSMGRHGALAKFRVCNAFVNIALSLVLVQFMGAEGVALAAVVPITVFEPLILYVVSRHVGFRVRQYIREVLLPLVSPLLLSGATYFWLLQVMAPTSYKVILLVAGAGSTVFLSSFLLFSISREERQLLLKAIKKSIFPKLGFHHH